MEKNEFKKAKIIQLNKYFMKTAIWSILYVSLIFAFSIGVMLYILSSSTLDDSIKISVLSMSLTFVITTSKSIIDRLLDIFKFYANILAEEQRAFNNSIGIEMDKTVFEKRKSNGE